VDTKASAKLGEVKSAAEAMVGFSKDARDALDEGHSSLSDTASSLKQDVGKLLQQTTVSA